jgi:NAD(P)-dependent dehydrogenase (short-subunit alcohol dehydrogenase family)
LVNNAGISMGGPLEFLPLDNLRQVVEVNVVGVVAVTQAFLPALRRARGRVVNMGSVSGRLALPLAGPYAMSKFALEAYTDALRREVGRWGIEVCVIEPGHIETPIWQKTKDRIARHRHEWPEELERLYGRLVDKVAANVVEQTNQSLPPKAVARVVHKALTARRPRTRYPVGIDARIGIWMNRLLPDRMVDFMIRRMLKPD